MTGNCPKKTNPDAVKIPVIRVRNKTFLNDRKASECFQNAHNGTVESQYFRDLDGFDASSFRFVRDFGQT